MDQTQKINAVPQWNAVTNNLQWWDEVDVRLYLAKHALLHTYPKVVMVDWLTWFLLPQDFVCFRGVFVAAAASERKQRTGGLHRIKVACCFLR